MYFRAKGARARVHFPATCFLYCSNSFLVFVNIVKEEHLKTQRYVREKDKKMEKSEFSVVKWSPRSEGFEDKKRRGRLILLNKAAKIVLKKVRCKLKETTR